MNPITKIKIYALICPNKKVRYVGKTELELDYRLAQHIRDAKSIIRGTCKRKINKRYSWIISLLNKNELPEIYLLENCSLENWKQREIYWISQFDDLTNITKGGDGGDTNSGRKFGPLSEERKADL